MASGTRKLLDRAGARISEASLIQFDHRTLLLAAALFIIFLFAVSLQLQGSSLPEWNNIVPQAGQEKEGLLLGEPRAVRSDEWMVGTPWALSQAQLDFPLKNPNLGANEDALVQSLPVEHFTSLAKPQWWAFYVAGPATGLSFYWNFKLFGLFASAFLFFMLLSGSRFWLSLAAAFWLLFSSFTQWWFSTSLPEMLVAFFLLFVSVAYLLLASRRWMIVLAGALAAFWAAAFVLILYPGFQVPLGYLMLFGLAGLLLETRRYRLVRSDVLLRAAVAAGFGALLVIFLFLFYLDARSTMQAIQSTVYPGARLLGGGGIGLERLFGGLTGLPRASEINFPPMWSDASAASNFILLFPVVFLALLWYTVRRIHVSPLLWALGAYLVVICAWMLVPFPPAAGRLTFLGYAESLRVIIGAGIASIAICVVFISRLRSTGRLHMPRPGFMVSSFLTFLVFVTLIIYALLLRSDAPDFFRWRWLAEMVLGITLLAWLLLRGREGLFSIAVVVAVLPNLLINPVSYGLGPLYDKDAMSAAIEVNNSRPGELWVTYGNNTLASFLKAGGLHVANGVDYTPDLDFYRALDPQGVSEQVYNRYADASFLEPPPPPGVSVSGNGDPQGARFQLFNTDAFIVYVDPCSPELDSAGVTNIATVYPADQSRHSCLALRAALPESHVWLYDRVAPAG